MIQNIILIIVILILLNNIKINKETSNRSKESFSNDNFKQKIINNKIPIYGDSQFNTFNYDNDDVVYNFQNFDVIKDYNKLELSNNKNIINKYNDLTKLNAEIPYIDTDETKTLIIPSKKNFVMPSEKDIIYDTKFFQPSDADIYNPFDKNQIKYQDRTIQDVYDSLVNKKVQNKKLKDTNQVKVGMFGEKTFNNVEWEYENEDDGMSYDPTVIGHMAL